MVINDAIIKYYSICNKVLMRTVIDDTCKILTDK